MRGMLGLLVLTAVAAVAQNAVVYHWQDGEAARLGALLQGAGYDVRVVDSAAVAADTAFMRAEDDLLVLGEARHFPAAGFAGVDAYLQHGGRLLLLGGQPFSEPIYIHDGHWQSRAELLEQLKTLAGTPCVLPPAAKWGRSSNDNKIASSWAIDAEGVVSYETALLSGWNTYQARVENFFPAGNDLLLFSARGNEHTTHLCIEFRERDDSRWYASVKIGPEWQDVVLTAADFRFWHDCKPTKPRGKAGDQFVPAAASLLQIGLAQSSHGAMPGSPLGFAIKGMRTAANPYAGLSFAAMMPPLETFYPGYKQYAVRDREGHYSTMNRFQGRGVAQGALWRWRPFRLTAAGELEREDDLWASPSLWLTHYLAGPHAGSRIATIAAPVDVSLPADATAVLALARRLMQPVELIAGGAADFCMYSDQETTLGAELAVMAPGWSGQGLCEISLQGPGIDESRRIAFSSADELAKQTCQWPWRPGVAGCTAVARVRLMVDGKELDSVEHDLTITAERAALRDKAEDFIRVAGSQFMLRGEPWYPVGVNFWTSNHSGLETPVYVKGILAPGLYDPLQMDKDLDTLQRLGFNMLSIQLKGDTGKENTLRNLLDFFKRCRRRNIYVIGYLHAANPMNFHPDEMRKFIVDNDFQHNATLFAYDICWEPGNSLFRGAGRNRFDAEWRQWLVERYGSIENALADWQCEPRRDKDGQVISPDDKCFSNDGPWRVMMAAYRRFMDDMTSARWGAAIRVMRELVPNQLISFRQGNTLPHDFALTGPVKHLDFICPEAYTIANSEDGRHAAGFLTRFVHYAANGKPIIWAEFGNNIWDRERMAVNPQLLAASTRYHEMMYQMALESGANGTSPWWWPGGYRINERSDFGITEPDGTPRPSAELLLTYAPQLKQPRDYPPGDLPFVVDRDAHAGGYWYMAFNSGRDAYREARAAGQQLRLYSAGTGTTSADTPLLAVGNVPATGMNPPKFLNAEFNRAEIRLADGRWHDLLAQPVLSLPVGTPIVLRVELGNLQEAAWLAPQGELRVGDVVLAADGAVAAHLPQDTPRFADATFADVSLGAVAAGSRSVSLQLTAWQRTAFGQKVTFTINAE
ncbi:hypothetical protein [Oligosphaera ethanolica]|uniref:Glycoside hydrolase family 42 N-terminal domain-containing protein n=1 Tax=Oligosphaera ethanolica TaxID=760260 RepID=A0AAE3VIV3_9BACT|nr:hypothetical protein [Oligosphaera ethanolica]MDQ0291098.1 hypothetical protein [Oligosphaera ethanolica]